MPYLEVSDFASEGVTLASVAHPDFEARAQQILEGQAAPLFELKPYLAIVANRNPRTVVAYTICWTTTQRNESTEYHRTQFQFPDAVAGARSGFLPLQGREIRTGEERLLGLGFEVWPPSQADAYREFGIAAIRRLGEVKYLRISLDAVIFDDGAMLGADEARLGEHFITFLQVKQALYRDILMGLENRGITEDVFAALRAIVASTKTPEAHDLVGLYQRMASGEALNLHHQVLLEVFRRALRREPFAIHRVPPNGGVY